MVDEPTFEIMKELNPQVGKMLQAVAVSETFADVVICLRDEGWQSERDKSDTIQSLRELHLDPVGQQICTLFKVDRMVPFQETQLETVRKLRAAYDQVQKGSQPSAETTPLSGSGDTLGRRPHTARNAGERTSDLPLPRAEPARQTTE
jgi:hypothetical protein